MEYLMRLLYVSRARQGLTDDDILHILKTSRARNAKDRITGVLCYGKGYFTQIIEGPDVKLLELYMGILRDPRHSDCLLLYVSPTWERLFDGWTMGYVDNTGVPELSFETLAKHRTEPAGKGRAAEIMEDLVRRLKRPAGPPD